MRPNPISPDDLRDFGRIGSRRAFVCGAILGLISRGRVSADSKSEPIARARAFLKSLFDPALNLLPEYRQAKVYWLFHDNYLAAKVLRSSSPDLAEKIEKAIRGFGVERSGKIEVLFNESATPLPFHHHRLIEVKRVGAKVIKTEVLRPKIHQDWRKYADLLFMSAIAQARTNRNQALRDLEVGNQTWDGKGFLDRVTAQNGLYATFKLALGLIAADRLAISSSIQGEMKKRLLTQQNPEGGFITDYDRTGKPIGLANVETTALAILALEGRS